MTPVLLVWIVGQANAQMLYFGGMSSTMQQGDWPVAEWTGRRPINKRQASSEEAGGVGVVGEQGEGREGILSCSQGFFSCP